MDNDPLSTDNTPATVVSQGGGVARTEGPREFVCGACGCRLARNGEILSTGEVYKKFLKHDQALEAKDREISALQEEIANLKKERDALKGSNAPSRRVGRVIEG